MPSGLDREALDLALEAVRDFARDRLPDAKLLELDRDDEFPIEIVRAMCGGELGIQLLFIAEAYGGMGGGAYDVYRVCETVARVDLGVATGVLATFLGSDPIHFGGTGEQKRRFLGAIAEQGLLMALRRATVRWSTTSWTAVSCATCAPPPAWCLSASGAGAGARRRTSSTG